jgi:hypothetical protein
MSAANSGGVRSSVDRLVDRLANFFGRNGDGFRQPGHQVSTTNLGSQFGFERPRRAHDALHFFGGALAEGE